MPAAKKAKKAATRAMSDEHKEALARGRTQGRAIRTYLEALETHRPKRGRKRTAESIERRLERIDDEISVADPMKRVQLTQERIDLTYELENLQGVVDISDLEAAFVEHAWDYSQAKGISKAAWREAGVSAAVLRNAGF